MACDGPDSDAWYVNNPLRLSSVPKLTDLNVSHCDFRSTLDLSHARIDTVDSIDVSYKCNLNFTDGR